ncbi:DeoR/GlpR family DNA-binding transcription regulator [Actinopolymorpha sp. B11F2]|uniref:DeoR/GlpR family DNA-binding transcription regulator n=1 Tax=Actinopolymorpha sp. B11F2 TaxID=3160862 RepID=UPI0032E45770
MTSGTDSGVQRRHAILRLLAESDRLDVAELRERFDVSEMTIRRDLAKLAEEGVLRRIHGGAVRAERSPFETRTVHHAEEKRRIAQRAAGLIGDNETVGIDIGTTAHAVARAIRDRSLVVVTNSVNVAVEFRGTSNKVLLLGGFLGGELCTVGSFATAALRRLHLTTLILGCGGLTPDRGLTFFDIEETEVRRAMLDIADRIVVVMDHSKFDHNETVVLAPLAEVDILVTDRRPPEPIREACDRHNVQIVLP